MQYTTYEIEICWQVTIIVRYNQFEETKQVGMILGLRKSKNSYTRIKQDYCISRVIAKQQMDIEVSQSKEKAIRYKCN